MICFRSKEKTDKQQKFGRRKKKKSREKEEKERRRSRKKQVSVTTYLDYLSRCPLINHHHEPH